MTIKLNIPDNLDSTTLSRTLLAPGRSDGGVLSLERPFPGIIPVGTLLGLKQKPMFRVEGVSWWPFPEETAQPAPGRAYWLSVLDSVQAGEYELESWKEGFSLAWITMSDKGAAGERVDSSGPLVESMARDGMEICLSRGAVVPDDCGEIKALLNFLALTEGFDLILTTGGTGVASRDVTPEATEAVIEKRLPGFEQAMMNASLAKTPHGAISRAVAGTLGGSLIINMPGSPRAVSENLEAILPALAHCIKKLQGDKSDCAALRA